MQNYYKLLNIAPTANEAEIKNAVHIALRLWSNRTNAPQLDRRQEAERMVKLLEEAEAILLNLSKRTEYDKQLKNAPRQEAATDKAVLDAAQDLVAECRKLLADGNIGDALYVATKATERDGGNPEAWALLGKARYLFGDVEDSIYEYKRAIKLKPNEGVYYSELGDIFNDTGKFDDALIQYKRAAQVEPNVAWYRADVGRLLAKQGNLEEAVRILEQCLKEEPDINAFRQWLTLAYLDSAANCCSVDPDTGNYYPTSKAQIIAAIGLVKKAEELNVDDQDIKSAVEQNKRAIRESIKRKYDGSTGAAVVGGIIWFCAYGLGLIFLPFYFFASRPPKYAIYKRVLGKEATGTQKTFQAVGKVADVIGANENVRGGINWAILIGTGLFLPVMAIVNYFKNYTGENDIKEIYSLLNGDSESTRQLVPPKIENLVTKNSGAESSSTVEQKEEPNVYSTSNQKNGPTPEKTSSPLPDIGRGTTPAIEREVQPLKPAQLNETNQQRKNITIKIPVNFLTKKTFLISGLFIVLLCVAVLLLHSHSHNANLAPITPAKTNVILKQESQPPVQNTAAGKQEGETPVQSATVLKQENITNTTASMVPAATSQMKPNENAVLKTLFSDNFTGSSVNNEFWTATGNTVVEEDNTIKILTTVTDHGGALESKPFEFNPDGNIVITRQVFLHYGNNYFMGQFGITVGSLPMFSIRYANMDYSDGATYMARNGLFLTRNNARPDLLADQANVSAPITPLWDAWFNEMVTYNPKSGVLEYFVNDIKQGTFNVGVLPQSSPATMTLSFSAWGWYIGHEHLMKNLAVRSTPVVNTVSSLLANPSENNSAAVPVALQAIMAKAQSGDTAAQLELGLAFADGNGVKTNYIEAIKWFHKAAEQGNARAQRELGNHYRKGLGVETNYVEAFQWFQKAADQNDALAQVQLGVAYAIGRGVGRDISKAVDWFRKAADQGDAIAQENLGMMYKTGRGVDTNYAQAFGWFQKAADQGSAVAQANLGAAYQDGHGVNKDFAEAIKWYSKAAQQGNVFAELNLGLIYKNGWGVVKNYSEARKWLQKAADQGNNSAKRALQQLENGQ